MKTFLTLAALLIPTAGLACETKPIPGTNAVQLVDASCRSFSASSGSTSTFDFADLFADGEA